MPSTATATAQRSAICRPTKILSRSGSMSQAFAAVAAATTPMAISASTIGVACRRRNSRLRRRMSGMVRWLGGAQRAWISLGTHLIWHPGDTVRVYHESGARHGHRFDPDGGRVEAGPELEVRGGGEAEEHVLEIAGDGDLAHGIGQLTLLDPESGGPAAVVASDAVDAHPHEFRHVEPPGD